MSNVRVPPFSPAKLNGTVSLGITTTPQTMQFDNFLPAGGGGAFTKSNTVRLLNIGPNLVFIELIGQGINGAVASKTTSMPLAPGIPEKISTGGASSISAVTDQGTATLFATPGEGL